MNKRAEAFKKYLDDRQIPVFQMQEVEGDEQESVIFRSHVGIEGQQLPTIVILDSSVFAMIRVQVSPQARTEENELALLRVMNEQNLAYKPFKLYFDGEGSLILDACLLIPGKVDDKGADVSTVDDFAILGDEVYSMFNVLINFLNQNYRTLMKSIWADGSKK